MIAVIILNYNTWETTINCIESIKKTSERVKIYVVDNNSPNNSYKNLMNKYSNDILVKVIQSSVNLGYAKGNNLGAKVAIEDGYKILLFSNNDIIYENGAINKMVKVLIDNDEISCVAPLIKSLNGEVESLPIVSQISIPDYLFSFTRLNKIKKLFNRNYSFVKKYELKIEKDNCLSKIYKFSGCCFMIKSNVFHEVNGFDDETFMYFEEDILCYKLEEIGFSSFHVADAIIQHHHGKSTGRNNFFVHSEMFKSEILYFTKYRNINIIYLSFLYTDRLATPLISIIKKRYKLSSKEYLDLIQTTLNTIIKHKFSEK